MKSPLKEIVVALLIGVLVGWFAASRFEERRGPHKKTHALERFSSELQLTPEQKEKIAQITEAKHEQLTALRGEMEPKFEQIRSSSKAEIRKVLTPKQNEKFEKMETRWEKRWKDRRVRRPQ